MRERMTERAQYVTVAAEDEAKSRGDTLIRPEHLMLATLRQGEMAPGPRELTQVGVDSQRLIAEIEQHTIVGVSQTAELAWDPSAEEIVTIRVADVARSFAHKYIGTEHNLLALLSTNGGPIQQAFDALGLHRNKVQAAVAERLRIKKVSQSPMWRDPGLPE